MSFAMEMSLLCRRARFSPTQFGTRTLVTDNDKAAAATRVWARRPDVSNQRLISEIEANSGRPTVFSRWLGIKDRVFRESMHGNTFTTRWLWAKSTDPLYDVRRWHRLQSPFRYPKTFTPKEWVKSDVVRRLIFPDLSLLFLSSTTLSIYNTLIASPGSILSLPTEPFGLAALAVGLLVTFRTQTSYSRYKEACQIWFHTVSTSRELCSRILTNVPTPKSKTNPRILRKRDHGAKLTQTFCHALKYHITVDGANADLRNQIDVDKTSDQKIMSMKRDALRDELQTIWDFNDSEELAIVNRLLHEDVHCWPLQVCQEIGHLNASEYVAPNAGGLGAPNAEGINNLVTMLQHNIAACENILQTPIYTPYTVFTGRILYVWVHTIPFVFTGLVGPIVTPMLSVSTAFLFLGIDDIGQRVEQPFGILPLWQYCEVIDKSCSQLFKNTQSLCQNETHDENIVTTS